MIRPSGTGTHWPVVRLEVADRHRRADRHIEEVLDVGRDWLVEGDLNRPELRTPRRR